MKNKKIVYALCISFCLVSLCFSLTGIVKAQTASLSINPETYEVAENEIGTTFTVDLEVSDVSNLWGWVAGLTWNPEVLNLTDIQEGPFLKDVASTFFVYDPDCEDIAQGFVSETICSFMSIEAVDGSGVLATITFESLGDGV